MTAPATPDSARGRVRTLLPGEEGKLAALFAADPVAHCFAAARVAEGGLHLSGLGGYMLGYERGDVLESALLVGANLVPINTDRDSRQELARHAVRMGRRSSSIVGPAEEVLDLWSLLRPYWGAARDERPDQPLMVAQVPPSTAPDPAVGRTRPDQLDTLFPACVDMFIEEVGVSPTTGGAEPAYRRRLAELISSGRSFARYEDDRPVFKAELGAVTSEACQVQGVWVPPDRRGEGLASAGMAAVAQLARAHSATVSLYVNSYNTAAVRAYENAGFRQTGTFATILF